MVLYCFLEDETARPSGNNLGTNNTNGIWIRPSNLGHHQPSLPHVVDPWRFASLGNAMANLSLRLTTGP